MQSVDDYLTRYPVKGRALVIGSKMYNRPDRRKLYDNAIGLDMEAGEGVDIVHDLEAPLDAGMFDHIDIVSVLEHVKRPWVMAENIENLMNPGATILLSAPFVWRIHAYPSDYWRMSKEALPILFPRIDWLDRCYIATDTLIPKPAVMKQRVGAYIQRTETLAFGIRNTGNA